MQYNTIYLLLVVFLGSISFVADLVGHLAVSKTRTHSSVLTVAAPFSPFPRSLCMPLPASLPPPCLAQNLLSPDSKESGPTYRALHDSSSAVLCILHLIGCFC